MKEKPVDKGRSISGEASVLHLEHWNNGTETANGIQGNKKFPNKAIFSVDEASSFVLDDLSSKSISVPVRIIGLPI